MISMVLQCISEVFLIISMVFDDNTMHFNGELLPFFSYVLIMLLYDYNLCVLYYRIMYSILPLVTQSTIEPKLLFST